jgi:L-fuconolactonase
MTLNRRTFLAAGAASIAVKNVDAADSFGPIPIVDSHVHMWDLTRPQGAAYPPRIMNGVKSEEQMLPSTYRKSLSPQGVVGVVAVEAGPWIEDNLWLAETCTKDTFALAAIGSFRPEAKEFPEYISRYARFPIFRGIRYGNIPGYNHDLVAQSKNPVFMRGLQVMANAGLVLEVANPKLDLFQAVVRINDTIPILTIIVDHLAGFVPPPEDTAGYDAVLREFERRPKIHGKISAFSITNPNVSPKLADHKARLDHLIGSFGEDRVFGAGYGNAGRPDLSLMKEYYSSKPRLVAEKFFWRNSMQTYKWAAREPNQPRAA